MALLLDYLEDRLPERDRRELDRHLASCASCVAQVRTYRSTIDLLHSLSDEDLPPELRTTLRSFLSGRSSN